MAYCTATDLNDRYGTTKIAAWSGNSNDVVAKVCADASAEVDGYIVSGGYETPIITVPELVKTHASSIAAYRLLVRKGMMGDADPGEQGIIDGYAQAVKFLEQVARGKLKLPITNTNTNNDARVSVQVHAHDKLDMGGFV